MNVDWMGLVNDNIEAYYEDMDLLNILRADDYPRCTDYVDDMIRIIEDLIEKKVMHIKQMMEYISMWNPPQKNMEF